MGGSPPWRLTNTHHRKKSIAQNVIYSDPRSVNFSLPFVFHI